MVRYFVKNPRPDQFSIMNQILRYLAGNPEKDIIFGRESELNLVRYSDSD